VSEGLKKKELQLSLDSFDTVSPFPCKAAPGINAHKKVCILCVHATRRKEHIFCSHFRRAVTCGQKYSLKEWKSARNAIVERDGCRCIICDREDGLHVHHIDSDKTNDDDSNLVTLCNFCHARAHIELGRMGGAARVKYVIAYYRLQRDREIERTDCE
jgi:hypothetical protein